MGKDYIKRSKRAARAAEKEEKGFEKVGPLDPSYGSFTIPSYPYGAKSPKTPDSQAIPPTLPTQCPQETSEAKGTEADEVPWCDGPAEYMAANPPKTEKLAASNETQTPGDQGQGDTLPTSTAAVASNNPPLACNLKRDVFNRLMREGRWWEIAPIRDRMVKEAKASGMEKEAAQVWAYTEINRLYPPLPPKADKPPPEPSISPVESPSAPESADLPGLYSIPPEWPPLPDNAALQVELGWVQSQRLAVVEERGNQTIVRLERASSPAPSKAALGWLETSIRSYAKYVEVAAKTLAGQADEAEATRRERMRLDDIRALLDEMRPTGRCPACGQTIDG